jgi:hypothetical protein
MQITKIRWRLRQGVRPSRGGLGLTTLVVFTLPMMLTIMALAVNGLAMAATYRRALSIASIGVQTGVSCPGCAGFDGGILALTANACPAAKVAACSNGGCNTTCNQAGSRLTLQVRLNPPLFLQGVWGALGLRTSLTATVAGEPKRGINTGE